MVRNPSTGVLGPAQDASEILRLFPELQKIIQFDFFNIIFFYEL